MTQDPTYNVEPRNNGENFTPNQGQIDYLHSKLIPFLPIDLMGKYPNNVIKSVYTNFNGPNIRILPQETGSTHRRILIEHGQNSISYLDDPENRTPESRYAAKDSNIYATWCNMAERSLQIAEERNALDWEPIISKS